MSFVENLQRDYGDFKINIPRWEILDEGVTVLWGPSGSGKTSVFRVLLGLEPCHTMKWSFQGLDLAKLKTPQRNLGVVFQSLDLFPHMTAKENILFAARARGIEEKTALVRLQELSDILKMESFLDRSCSILSGGEKQRVAISRAVMGRPRLLLLDEPFSALDQELREESRRLLKRVIDEEKIPTLLVTHDIKDVETLANKVTSIRDGSIVDEKLMNL